MKHSDIDIKEFIIGHYQYFAAGVLFICLIIVLALSGRGREKSSQEGESSQTGETQTEAAATEVEIPDVALETDAYPAVCELMSQYLKAVESGDSESIKNMVLTLDEKQQIRIEKKAEYIESIDNLVCYTKPGPEENSYVVFEYNEIKYKNIDTAAPSLNSFLVKTREDGTLYIYNDDISEAESSYLKGISEQQDVNELLEEVDKKYSTAIGSDENLARFMEALPTALDSAVSTELAERESQKEAGTEGGSSAANVEAKVKETINVRGSASTEGEKLGQLMGGDTITVVANLDNGWSQIDFQGQEAYVKTEFLEMSESPAQAAADQESTETTDTAAETTDTAAEAAGSESVAGKIKIKERVRIRKSPSTDGEQLGSADGGAEFEYYSESDGWTKINYNGQTAYVKSDYVSKE